MPAISDKMLLDDVIYEVDWDGDIVWEWKVSDHFEEMGFDAIARNLMYRDPNYYTGFGNSHIAGDWVHTNSMSVSARTNGTTLATSASTPTTSSSTAATPTSS